MQQEEAGQTKKARLAAARTHARLAASGRGRRAGGDEHTTSSTRADWSFEPGRRMEAEMTLAGLGWAAVALFARQAGRGWSSAPLPCNNTSKIWAHRAAGSSPRPQYRAQYGRCCTVCLSWRARRAQWRRAQHPAVAAGRSARMVGGSGRPSSSPCGRSGTGNRAAKPQPIHLQRRQLGRRAALEPACRAVPRPPQRPPNTRRPLRGASSAVAGAGAVPNARPPVTCRTPVAAERRSRHRRACDAEAHERWSAASVRRPSARAVVWRSSGFCGAGIGLTAPCSSYVPRTVDVVSLLSIEQAQTPHFQDEFPRACIIYSPRLMGSRIIASGNPVSVRSSPTARAVQAAIHRVNTSPGHLGRCLPSRATLAARRPPHIQWQPHSCLHQAGALRLAQAALLRICIFDIRHSPSPNATHATVSVAGIHTAARCHSLS